MKLNVGEFVDLWHNFHDLPATEQICRFVYFHTVLERRETVSMGQLEQLFEFADLPVPPNLDKLLAYLCAAGRKLLAKNGEYYLQRPIRKRLDQELMILSGKVSPPKVDGVAAFDFQGKAFKDKKVAELLKELRKCYAQECWNASGILVRIVVERALDSVDPSVKAKQGLKDKINYCIGETSLFSQTVREGLKGLHASKIIGDIAAHHSSILLDKPDIDLALPAFRMLLKEIETL
jgi:hypothetical protein